MTSVAWDLWRSFLAVMDARSISGAARQLGLSQPTVGRQVAALERDLGQSLFTRSQSGIEPTPAALALRAHAEDMAAAAAALQRTASGTLDSAHGIVRLAASEVMGVEILPRILADFREIHPEIVIELTLSNRNADLLRRDADLAIRMVRPMQQAIVTRRIGDVPVGLFAHRDYVARHGLPEAPTDLFGHALIGPERGFAEIADVEIGGHRLTPEMFALRVDGDIAQLAALRAGVGIGVCQRRIAATDPELVPVLADMIAFDLELWLAIHEDLRSVRRVRLLFDHLSHHLAPWASR